MPVYMRNMGFGLLGLRKFAQFQRTTLKISKLQV